MNKRIRRFFISINLLKKNSIILISNKYELIRNKKNTIMEEIHEYEIDGLLQTMKESGIKGIMKYSDVLTLNHMMERGWIPSFNERDSLIKNLKENTDMSYGEITELLQRYNEWKRFLPSYSLGLNEKLNSINKRMNSVVPFKWIDSENGKRLLGFVNEGNQITVYDGGGNHLMKICSIDKKNWSIYWNDYVKLHPHHQHYIIGEVKNLKKMIM